MAVLGLRFCARASSSCSERGPLFIVVGGPLTIVASLVAEHRLQTRRLSSCGSRAQPLRGMWDPPRPGLEPVSPALAGRFSTTVPPGKPPFLASEQREQALLGLFFWSVPVGISWVPTSPAPSLGCMRQKENPGDSTPCWFSGSRVSSWSPFFSLPFRVFLYHFIYNTQGSYLYLAGGLEKSTSRSALYFPEAECKPRCLNLHFCY